MSQRENTLLLQQLKMLPAHPLLKDVVVARLDETLHGEREHRERVVVAASDLARFHHNYSAATSTSAHTKN